MFKEKVYLSPPHMNGTEMNYIQQAFEQNWIAPLGPNVDAFEKEVAEYVGADYGLALSSGTAAIHLTLKYIGVTMGDYVFCSSLTFSGSCNAIMYEKAIPVFIDSEPDTWNMSPSALEKAFQWAKKQNKMPKAVIVVNLYGQSANWKEILPICEQYNVPIIEDAAESLGATYEGKQTGIFGEYGIFSFNGNKIITSSGGGMVVCNNKEAIDKMKFWATQSREPELHYEHKEIGYNYRMSNICAGIGRGQLTTLHDKIKRKKEIYATYKEAFKDLPVKMMNVDNAGEPNYWLSVMTIESGSQINIEHTSKNDTELNNNSNIIQSSKIIRDIMSTLEKENVESRPVWKPMHLQPIFKEYPFFSHMEEGSFSQWAFENGVCLPSGTGMSDEVLKEVINIIKSVIN